MNIISISITRLMLLAAMVLFPLQALAETMDLFVSITPQKYFLEQIGGDLVTVHVMVEPGASPATYEPKPWQMTELSEARAYFSIGVPFEKVWLDRIASTNPGMVMVPTDKDVPKQSIAAHSHHEHGEEHPGEEHDHGPLDPHIWLSPALVKIQARTMARALMELDPANKDVYTANLKAFNAHLDKLDAEIQTILIPAAGNSGRFMVFHPSWGYFADHYGLTQIAVESQGDEPGPRELARIVDQARELGIKVVFVQPQFSEKSAKLIAKEIGGEVAALDPLAPDWSENLLRAAKALAKAVK